MAPPVSRAGVRIRVRSRILLATFGALAFLTLLQAFLYLRLPYRSSWFVATTAEEVAAEPTPNFRLGAVEWPVSSYGSDPTLEPFRAAFRSACRQKLGLAAGLCVSDAMARQFPQGNPSTEFTDLRFDPVAHLKLHTAGAAGHCMNRVAIMAAQLLSVGIPARVTQLLPAEGRGHNVVEVWDAPNGWVVVDPTYGTVLGDGQRPAGAVRLRLAPEHVPWHTLANAPAPNLTSDDRRRSGPDTRLYRGRIVYPEPWLYLRVGARQAVWPFRGTFACVGANALECGGAQQLLRLGILGFGLAALGFLAAALRAQRREAVQR